MPPENPRQYRIAPEGMLFFYCECSSSIIQDKFIFEWCRKQLQGKVANAKSPLKRSTNLLNGFIKKGSNFFTPSAICFSFFLEEIIDKCHLLSGKANVNYFESIHRWCRCSMPQRYSKDILSIQ